MKKKKVKSKPIHSCAILNFENDESVIIGFDREVSEKGDKPTFRIWDSSYLLLKTFDPVQAFSIINLFLQTCNYKMSTNMEAELEEWIHEMLSSTAAMDELNSLGLDLTEANFEHRIIEKS